MVRLILMTDFTEAFAHYLLQGIYKYASTPGDWIVCRMPPAYKERFGLKAVVTWAKKWKADAIIGQFSDTDDVSLFRKNGIIALAQDYKSRFSVIPNITSDYFATGAKAADFFIKRRYRHFAFFGYRNVVWSDERYMGYRRRLEDLGMEVSPSYQEQDISELWHYDAEPIRRWLDSLPKPVAIFACDDNQGTKLIEVCNVAGYKVPEDVAVLGVDNDETVCQMSFPPQSSIVTDSVQGGYDAAKLIDDILAGRVEPSGETNVVIRPLYIVSRTSTNVIATEDADVQKVLRFIYDNVHRKINVDDVLATVPMSRKLLEIRFRKAMGDSIYHFIGKVKLERFRSYLINMDRPVGEIAGLVGEEDPNNIFRRFRKVYGCTPMEYRRKHNSQNASD